uniref:UPF0489 protein C5orf22 n=1 Tax=Ceratitis capitata TaxID=7213 RepID=W8BZX7_CERCA
MEANVSEQNVVSVPGEVDANDGLVESSSATVTAASESVSTENTTTTVEKSNVKVSIEDDDAETEEEPPLKRNKTENLVNESSSKAEDDEISLSNISTTSVAGTIPDKTAQTLSKSKHFNFEEAALKSAHPRKFQRIPIFVADYHNDVLEFIYRSLATRHLPLANNIMIHFDSHPDMVISREIPASASFDKETMLAELSIENWIMPACYAGHFNRIVWLKNSWCQQIPNGKHNFKIGNKNDKISVDCPIDYFISEGNYVETKELQEARDMELQVFDVDTTLDSAPIDPTQFLKPTDAPNFVLDIDLDFFSTSNPFLEIYKDANCYEQLTDIFRYHINTDDCGDTTARRKLQLEALKNIFEQLEEKRNLEVLSPAPDPNIITPEIYTRIDNLVKSLQKHYADDEIDWLLIYDSGSTTDANGLPHHISTSEELEQYFGQFKQFLEKLPIPPVLITIACSAEDDYCPRQQVDLILARVLKILREVFGERLHKKPILHYLDEEWDVMKL